MRLVQNVQIVIIVRDILINLPDFIESLKRASPQPSPEGAQKPHPNPPLKGRK